MAENSHISWTDNTHNEWIGCTKVSAGCDHCYAEREQDKRHHRAKWGKGNSRYRTSEANRKKPFVWNRQAEKEGRRIRVFTASLSDVFDEEVPDEWRHELFATIRQTPHLDWLVLTKRLAKMRRYVEWSLGNGLLPSNIWWGCSVEGQTTANQRIPELLKLRQWVGDAPLWLSIEPLLGPVDLSAIRHGSDPDLPIYVDWVVVGGESGPSARPMQPGWPRSLRDQCVAEQIPFHFKQWGEWAPVEDGSLLPGDRLFPKNDEAPSLSEDPVMRRVGKKAAGRLLDGKEWNEFPKGKY
jgi:protein gp37